jgi:hypothetical protein
VRSENAIEVFRRLSHQGFDLPSIFWRIGFVAEVSQLPFTTTLLLLAHPLGVYTIDRGWAWRRVLGENGGNAKYEEEGKCD